MTGADPVYQPGTDPTQFQRTPRYDAYMRAAHIARDCGDRENTKAGKEACQRVALRLIEEAQR